MAVNVQLSELIVKLKAEGARQTKDDIETVEEAFEDLAEMTGFTSDDIEKDLEQWGLAFKVIGASAAGVFGGLVLAGPIAKTQLGGIVKLFGTMADMLLAKLGITEFITGVTTDMAEFIKVWDEEGLLGAIIDLDNKIVEWIAGKFFPDVENVEDIALVKAFRFVSELFLTTFSFLIDLSKSEQPMEDLKLALKKIVGRIEALIQSKWDDIKANAWERWGAIKTSILTRVGEMRDDVVERVNVLTRRLGLEWLEIDSNAQTSWDEIFATIKGRWIAGLASLSPQIAALKAAVTLARLASRLFGGGETTETSGQVGEASGRGIIRPSFITAQPTLARGLSSPIENHIIIELDGRVVAKSVSKHTGTSVRSKGGGTGIGIL